MLTIKNRCAVFATAALLLAGCMPPGPRALLEGKRLLERGKYAEAIERFQTATSLLATNAQAWQAWNYLGLACQYSGDAPGAEKAYQRSLMSNPDSVEARYNLGCLWLSQNKFEAAKSQFTTYTLRRGNSFEGFLKLGTVQLRLSEEHGPQLRSIELGAAEKAFSDAARLASENPECWNALGVAKLQRGRPTEAVQCFNEALKQQSNYGPSLLNLAIVSQQYLRDRQGALEKYREYLETRPAPANVESVRAIVTQLEQEPNPSTRASTTPGTRPLEADAHTTAAPAGQPGLVKPASASDTRTVSVTRPETNPLVVRSAAVPTIPGVQSSPSLNKMNGATVPAESAIKPTQVGATEPPRPTLFPDPAAAQATSESNSSKSTKRSLLQRLFGSKDDSRTIEATGGKATPVPGSESNSLQVNWSGPRYPYHRPVKLAAGNRSAAERWFTQGLQAQQTQRLSVALQAYREATQLDPSFFEAYYNLGLAAEMSGKLTTALPAYEDALAIRPDSVDARYNFALALQRANYVGDAVVELEKITASNPNDSKAHLALGNLYGQQLHQPANAKQHYLRVLEIDPHNPQANAIRSWLAAN
jgi:tetratricopeptide (TPR) repeat protein